MGKKHKRSKAHSWFLLQVRLFCQKACKTYDFVLLFQSENAKTEISITHHLRRISSASADFCRFYNFKAIKIPENSRFPGFSYICSICSVFGKSDGIWQGLTCFLHVNDGLNAVFDPETVNGWVNFRAAHVATRSRSPLHRKWILRPAFSEIMALARFETVWPSRMNFIFFRRANAAAELINGTQSVMLSV